MLQADTDEEVGDFLFRLFVPIPDSFVVCSRHVDIVSGRRGGLFEYHFQEGVGVRGVVWKIRADFFRVNVVGREWKVMRRTAGTRLADVLMH